ncbi:MAG TPA: GxxExxY protein [Bryobacteraceae bacterium]|nr:GxxExxY protein [Bryobacteraceae bacterium]
MTENEITERIMGAAIEVHKHLGPGLLASAYDECLCYELSRDGFRFERQVHLPMDYKGFDPDGAYRMDLAVGKLGVVGVRAVDDIHPAHHLSSPRKSPDLRASAVKEKVQ